MRNQHTENLQVERSYSSYQSQLKKKSMLLIAVVAGKRSNQISSVLQGVDYVIEGGQTMNPSTEDFIKAVEQVNAITSSSCQI